MSNELEMAMKIYVFSFHTVATIRKQKLNISQRHTSGVTIERHEELDKAFHTLANNY